MKTIPIALAADYAQRGATIACCLKVTRQDATVLGLTSTDHKLVIGGVTYYPGFTYSDSVSSAGLDVENQEATVFPGTSLLTQNELAAGLWDNAAWEMFEVNHKAVADGVTPSRRGTTGEAQLNQGQWTIEFRGLKQAFQQSLGIVSSKTCRYRLGSTTMANGGLCTVDLTPFTFACTATGVTSRQQFADTARTQAAEWFVEGTVTFTTGLNANPAYARKVKVFTGGTFTLTQSMPFDVVVGDEFTAVTGCQKRHERTTLNPAGISDCIDKFNNILNFGGEPHLPGIDGLTALPSVVTP